MSEPREDRVQELAEKLQASEQTEPAADQPESDVTPDEQAGSEAQEPQQNEDSFYELDLSTVPEDADREWLAKRHLEMQRAFTKKTQTLAEQRREAEKITAAFNDPQQLEALLRARGYDLEDEEYDDEDEFLDDEQAPDFRDPRVDALLEHLTQAEREQAEEESFRQQIDELETREGREISDKEWDGLWRLTQTGLSVDDAYEWISDLRKNERKSLVNAKKDAPQVSKVGKSATQVPDLSDERARVEYMAELMQGSQD